MPCQRIPTPSTELVTTCAGSEAPRSTGPTLTAPPSTSSKSHAKVAASAEPVTRMLRRGRAACQCGIPASLVGESGGSAYRTLDLQLRGALPHELKRLSH